MSGVLALKRGFSTSAVRGIFNRDPFKKHPPGGMKLWRNMSLFVALPAVAIMSVNMYIHMKEEWEHPPPRPEFIPYDHLRIRTKRFPWGDGNKSLFHNPHVNALPGGYEEDHSHPEC